MAAKLWPAAASRTHHVDPCHGADAPVSAVPTRAGEHRRAPDAGRVLSPRGSPHARDDSRETNHSTRARFPLGPDETRAAGRATARRAFLRAASERVFTRRAHILRGGGWPAPSRRRSPRASHPRARIRRADPAAASSGAFASRPRPAGLSHPSSGSSLDATRFPATRHVLSWATRLTPPARLPLPPSTRSHRASRPSTVVANTPASAEAALSPDRRPHPDTPASRHPPMRHPVTTSPMTRRPVMWRRLGTSPPPRDWRLRRTLSHQSMDRTRSWFGSSARARACCSASPLTRASRSPASAPPRARRPALPSRFAPRRDSETRSRGGDAEGDAGSNR